MKVKIVEKFKMLFLEEKYRWIYDEKQYTNVWLEL